MSSNLEMDFKCDLTDAFTSEENCAKMIVGQKDVHDKAETLYCNLKSYLSNSEIKLMKQNLYFDYIIQIPKYFSLCFSDNSIVSNMEEENDKDRKLKNLQTAEVCMKILLTYLESPKTSDVSKSLIQSTFAVLHQAYSHCKKSEEFYGEFFSEFTIELGKFYNHIQDVQKAVLKELEELINSNLHDGDMNTYIALLTHDVGKLCELVTSLDKRIAAALWKIFTKMILKYKSIVQKELEVLSFLLPLILNIKDVITLCIYSVERKEEVDQLEIKMCVVELSTLKKIVEVFSGFLKEDLILQIRSIALLLYKLLILCYYTNSEGKSVNILNILLRTGRYVIATCFTDSMLLDSILYCTPEEISADMHLPLVLLKLTAVEYVNSNSKKAAQLQNGEILVEVLTTVIGNKPDDDFKLTVIKIPSSLIMETEQTSTNFVSLYQICFTCLAESSKQISYSTDDANEFEKKLLHILDSSSDLVSLLISDIWIYYLRCRTTAHVFKSCTNILDQIDLFNSNFKIEQLLKRMLKFLPSESKIALFEKYKSLLHLACTHKEYFEFDVSHLTNVSLSNNNSCVHFDSTLKDLYIHTSDDMQQLIKKACAILEIANLYIDKLLLNDLMKLLEFSTLIFESEIFEIQATVISFLKALNRITLSRNGKELDTLTSTIAQLFSTILKSQNYIIRLQGFNMYFSFAQSSSHLDMIKKTVVKSPCLVSSIKSFANKIPSSGLLEDEARHQLTESQLDQLHFNTISAQQFSNKSKQILYSFTI